ncbi:MAG: DUF4340 domain-containing protein [Ignavibacteriaceae bacterium]
MFNKISSKALAVIFVVLLVLSAVYIYFDSSREERSFRTDIVNIDTAKVTSISIYPKANNHKEIKIFKEGNNWEVQLTNNNTVPAENSKITNLIYQLSKIKANSVAAQDESKWSEFKVDTSGTRVKIFEGKDNTLDIVIGKFAYHQPRTMMTYVRVKGDKNVYETNGFLEFSFNQKPDYFRDNTIVNDDMSHWKRLTFTYPADSSFQLIKDSTNHWNINKLKIDSSKTAIFLRTLSHLTGSEFADNPDESLLSRAAYTLTIESSALGAITISAYIDSTKYLIHSSQNPDAYFNGKKNNLKGKIFIGKNYFAKKK